MVVTLLHRVTYCSKIYRAPHTRAISRLTWVTEGDDEATLHLENLEEEARADRILHES